MQEEVVHAEAISVAEEKGFDRNPKISCPSLHPSLSHFTFLCEGKAKGAKVLFASWAASRAGVNAASKMSHAMSVCLLLPKYAFLRELELKVPDLSLRI